MRENAECRVPIAESKPALRSPLGIRHLAFGILNHASR